MTSNERNYKRRRMESNLAEAGLLDKTDSKRRELEETLRRLGVPEYNDYQAPRQKTAAERDRKRKKQESVLAGLLQDPNRRKSAHKTSNAASAHNTAKTRNAHRMTPDARRAFKKLNEERRKAFPEADFPDGVEIR